MQSCLMNPYPFPVAWPMKIIIRRKRHCGWRVIGNMLFIVYVQLMMRLIFFTIPIQCKKANI